MINENQGCKMVHFIKSLKKHILMFGIYIPESILNYFF